MLPGIPGLLLRRVHLNSFFAAGGPFPLRSVIRRRSAASLQRVRPGGPEVRKTRPNKVDASDGAFLELFCCSSTAPSVYLQRRFKNVLGILGKLQEGGFPALSRLTLTWWRALMCGRLLQPSWVYTRDLGSVCIRWSFSKGTLLPAVGGS